ncbi:hypothetical protein Maq22A_3p50025 (plasmid) [Methylobacterium aquaticum]|uniref:Uncharacterized protein n=1 Tax=Methylobacterium aquaticum TaxID=270351 RepID=A0A0C6FC69_9HYPH|nr:hypothetical protein Maq22A_3p50025 [Methylobacterium aquaticum]
MCVSTRSAAAAVSSALNCWSTSSSRSPRRSTGMPLLKRRPRWGSPRRRGRFMRQVLEDGGRAVEGVRHRDAELRGADAVADDVLGRDPAGGDPGAGRRGRRQLRQPGDHRRRRQAAQQAQEGAPTH